jgi:hypothetical protein
MRATPPTVSANSMLAFEAALGDVGRCSSGGCYNAHVSVSDGSNLEQCLLGIL